MAPPMRAPARPPPAWQPPARPRTTRLPRRSTAGAAPSVSLAASSWVVAGVDGDGGLSKRGMRALGRLAAGTPGLLDSVLGVCNRSLAPVLPGRHMTLNQGDLGNEPSGTTALPQGLPRAHVSRQAGRGGRAAAQGGHARSAAGRPARGGRRRQAAAAVAGGAPPPAHGQHCRCAPAPAARARRRA